VVSRVDGCQSVCGYISKELKRQVRKKHLKCQRVMTGSASVYGFININKIQTAKYNFVPLPL